MKTSRFLVFIAAAFAGLSSLFSGCASGPKPTAYAIKVELAPSLVGGSVDIHLIGANALSDLPKWQTISVTDYWKPENRHLRDAEKAVLQFGPGKPNVQTFSSTDPIWSRWLSTGALHLVVLVDLPGISSDRDGNADPRRLILPLDVKKWPSDVKTVELRIQESGIRLLTPIKGA